MHAQGGEVVVVVDSSGADLFGGTPIDDSSSMELSPKERLLPAPGRDSVADNPCGPVGCAVAGPTPADPPTGWDGEVCDCCCVVPLLGGVGVDAVEVVAAPPELEEAPL